MSVEALRCCSPLAALLLGAVLSPVQPVGCSCGLLTASGFLTASLLLKIRPNKAAIGASLAASSWGTSQHRLLLLGAVQRQGVTNACELGFPRTLASQVQPQAEIWSTAYPA